MQLIRTIVVFGFVCCSGLLYAQRPGDSSKVNLDDAKLSILFNYYEQNGIHSPVTGGRGTEKLTNAAPTFQLYVPLDTNDVLTVDGGVDFYSSASSDNIDNPYLVDVPSGASADDYRAHFNFGYTNVSKHKKQKFGVNAGFSTEFDVLSTSVGFSYGKESKDRNKSVNLKLNYFYDDWKLIYPIELRNGSEQLLPTDKRHSVSLSTTYAMNLTKKINMSATLDLVGQTGLLSTPFHRTYIAGDTATHLEILPSFRFKIPLGLRFNFYIADWMKIKTFYRFYYDTWNLIGNTASVEIPLTVKSVVTFYPFYRIHHQKGADYFDEFGMHDAGSNFRTSDFDLSSFVSHKFGLGVSIHPLFGIYRHKGLFRKEKVSMMKSIDIRYARYLRGDGLKANSITIGFNFTW